MKLSLSKLSSSWHRWTDRLSGLARDSRSSRRGQRRAPATRRLFLESLEDRTLLSGSALGTSLPDLFSLQAPVLGYSTTIGGSNSDYCHGLAVDSSGNAYVIGETASTSFSGASHANAGNWDAFVSKLSPSGDLLWSTLIGGKADDRAYGIALDPSGNIFITGVTTSADFPLGDKTDWGNQSPFVSKLSSDGQLLWSTTIGIFASSQSIALGPAGDIYITGILNGNTFPGTNQTNQGYSDAFVSKLDSSGKLVWSTLLGGSGSDMGYGIAVDSSGNAYAVGQTNSDSFPGTNQTTAGLSDIFVSKLDSSGGLLWSTLVGGNAGEINPSIVLSPSGDIYISGSTYSSTFPGTSQHLAGAYDAFVTKLTSDGDLLWSTLVGGRNDDFSHSIALDSSGDVYITGFTASSPFPGTNQTLAGGPFDAFVSKLNSEGNLLWSFLIGGKGGDSGYGIAADPSGNIYVAGHTNSKDFPGPNGAIKPVDPNGDDIFVVKLVSQDGETTPIPVLTSLSHTSIAAGSGQVTLIVNGSGFIPESVVQWNGTALATTYVSATRLTAVVPAENLLQAGMAGITVVNLPPDGGDSNALLIFVTEASPTDRPNDPVSPTDEPASPGTSPLDSGVIADQGWSSFSGWYHLLCYQYFSKLGLDHFSSLAWGSVFAQFNLNLGMARGASPVVSLLLLNHFLNEGGDPYTSGLLAANWTGQGSSFTPASGAAGERVAVYYQNLGLAPDGLSDLYVHALDFGHPDDAIAALIAAQHGVQLV